MATFARHRDALLLSLVSAKHMLPRAADRLNSLEKRLWLAWLSSGVQLRTDEVASLGCVAKGR